MNALILRVAASELPFVKPLPATQQESIVHSLRKFDMAKARIKQEWAWYCPLCKARNCTGPVVAELSPYEQIELKREHGFDDCATGDFFTVPSVVTCCECEEDFDTEVE